MLGKQAEMSWKLLGVQWKWACVRVQRFNRFASLHRYGHIPGLETFCSKYLKIFVLMPSDSLLNARSKLYTGGKGGEVCVKNKYKISSNPYPEPFCLLTPQIAAAECLELCDDASQFLITSCLQLRQHAWPKEHLKQQQCNAHQNAVHVKVL